MTKIFSDALLEKKIKAVLGAGYNPDRGLTEADMRRLDDAGVFDPRVKRGPWAKGAEPPAELLRIFAQLEALDRELERLRGELLALGLQNYRGALGVVREKLKSILDNLRKRLT